MKRFLKVMAVAILVIAAFTQSAPRALAQSDPVIKIHSGKYYDWYTTQSTWNSLSGSITPDFAIFDNSIDRIIADWGVAPPPTHMYCYVDPSGQNGAYATGDIGPISAARGASPSPGIGINSNLFTASGYGVAGGTAIVFGVHESVNDMTGLISSGWPRDWWADDRSPFPGMTEVHVLNELGFNGIATADDQNLSGDPLYVMFKNIQNHYGWGVFSRMFSKMRANNVSWPTVDSGHNPSSVLTNLVTAYMVIGSGDLLMNMNSFFTSATIPGYDINVTQANLNSLGYDIPYFMIVNKYSGMALDLIGGDKSNGARINQWATDFNGINQKWAIMPTEFGDHFKILSWNSGKCACIDGNSLSNGAQLHDWDYTGYNPGQQWDLIDVGNGYFKIKNVNSGLILDDSAYGTTNDNKIQQWTDYNTDNQVWRLQPLGNYFIRADSGRYICIQGMGSENGSPIIQFDWQNNPWFMWNFQSEGDGWYGLFSLNAPGRVLCVQNGSYAASYNTHLWDYNPSNYGDQKIRILPKTNGKYKFYFKHDGMSWDIPGGQTGNFVPLQQYPDNGNSWQEFSLMPTN